MKYCGSRNLITARFIRTFCTLVVVGILACDRKGVRVGGTLQVGIDSAGRASNPALTVNGLSSQELRLLHAMSGDSALPSLFRVGVLGHSETSVSGRYVVNDSALLFEPTYPFDAGRMYETRVNLRGVFATRVDTLLATVMPRAAGNMTPTTVVNRILPSVDTLPENLLRLYVEFSAPMSRTSALPYIKLLDSDGNEVRDAFLPLEADFWNDSLTRYTIFLDPGRVKRGILPNEQMGRAILAGKQYTIAIDSTWPDVHGRMLMRAHRRAFFVSSVDETRIAYKQWIVHAPKSDRAAPLAIMFDRPLDHGLLMRAIGVEAKNGRAIDGTITVSKGERSLIFRPSMPWIAGDYNVVVFNMLEDPAGNRIDRAFEVDMFDRVDSTSAPEKYRIPFSVR